MSSQTPPIEWENLPPPPDFDFSMPDDPFPDDFFMGSTFDYLSDDDPFMPFEQPMTAETTTPASGAPT